MDAGEESVTDKNELARLRATAKSIHRRALITAIVATLVALVFPAA